MESSASSEHSSSLGKEIQGAGLTWVLVKPLPETWKTQNKRRLHGHYPEGLKASMHAIPNQHSQFSSTLSYVPWHPSLLPLPHHWSVKVEYNASWHVTESVVSASTTQIQESRLARARRPQQWRGYFSSMWLGLLEKRLAFEDLVLVRVRLLSRTW